MESYKAAAPCSAFLIGPKELRLQTFTENGASLSGTMKAGGVKCWGWNMYGQLGDGSTDDSGPETCGDKEKKKYLESCSTKPVDVVGF